MAELLERAPSTLLPARIFLIPVIKTCIHNYPRAILQKSLALLRDPYLTLRPRGLVAQSSYVLQLLYSHFAHSFS